MWCRFYADYWAPLGDDTEPEFAAIDIDMIDGHIATPADERQLAQWQQTYRAPGCPRRRGRRLAVTAR